MPTPAHLLQAYADTIVNAAATRQELRDLDVDEQFEIEVRPPSFELGDGDFVELRHLVHDGAMTHGLALDTINEVDCTARFRVMRKVAHEPYQRA